MSRRTSKWDPGGGALEFGEKLEEAVRREIEEEYRADVLNLRQVGVSSILRYQDGQPTHWVAVVFAALVNPSQVSIGEPDKMDELGWFNINQLPFPLHSQFEPFLQMVRVTGVLDHSADN